MNSPHIDEIDLTRPSIPCPNCPYMMLSLEHGWVCTKCGTGLSDVSGEPVTYDELHRLAVLGKLVENTLKTADKTADILFTSHGPGTLRRIEFK